MYPPKFDYYRASSVDEALSLMGQHPGAKLLAGGHSLIPSLNLRLADPGVLIDLGRIASLKGITASGGGFSIGAMTTYATVVGHAGLPKALTEAAGLIGDPQVRNRGTVGGNVSHADPASDLPPVMLALGAHFHVSGSGGSRDIAADDFFTGLFETALGEDEVLTAVTVPAHTSGTGSAYVKFPNPASRYALVSAAAVVTVSAFYCTSARVAIGGATPTAVRAHAVEAALAGQAANEASFAAAAAKVTSDLGDDVLSDIHASADYRANMAVVMVKRALAAAASRAQPRNVRG